MSTLTPAGYVVTDPPIEREIRMTTLTAGQIANPTPTMLADLAQVYVLNVEPFTRYVSNGTKLVADGSASPEVAGLVSQATALQAQVQGMAEINAQLQAQVEAIINAEDASAVVPQFAIDMPSISASSVVDGQAVVGGSLSASFGFITGTRPVSVKYQWQRLISGTWTDISGATAAAFTTANAGDHRCVMTPTNAAGDGTPYETEPISVINSGFAPALSTLNTSALRREYLKSEWSSRRDAARVAGAASNAPTIGTAVHINFAAATNGSATFNSPRNTLFDYSLPEVEAVSLLFPTGVQQLQDDMMFATGCNLQISLNATTKKLLIGSYDPATGARVWGAGQRARLRSSQSLTTPTSPNEWLGRPIIRIDAINDPAAEITISGIEGFNDGTAICYDFLHIVNLHASAKVLIEHVPKGSFPLGPTQNSGFISPVMFKVGGNGEVRLRFCESGIYGDGLWVSRPGAGTLVRAEWCEFVCDPTRQNIAGPDPVQIERQAGANVGAIELVDCYIENRRNQKAGVIVSGGTVQTSGESILIDRCIAFGADTTSTAAAGPSNEQQVLLNLNVRNATVRDSYLEGSALPVKVLQGSTVQRCVVVRDAQGAVVSGTNWFAGAIAEGSSTVMDSVTLLSLGLTGGTAMQLFSGSGVNPRNTLILGGWATPIANAGGGTPAGTVQNTTDAATVRVDEIGRVRNEYRSALAASVADSGVANDFLGNVTSSYPTPKVVGALQVAASVVAPAISDTTPTRDQVLSLSRGTWTGDPTPTLTSQLFRVRAGSADQAISGATGTSYTVQAADVGWSLVLQVTATNTLAGASTPTSVTVRSAVTSLVDVPAPPSGIPAAPSVRFATSGPGRVPEPGSPTSLFNTPLGDGAVYEDFPALKANKFPPLTFNSNNYFVLATDPEIIQDRETDPMTGNPYPLRNVRSMSAYGLSSRVCPTGAMPLHSPAQIPVPPTWVIEAPNPENGCTSWRLPGTTRMFERQPTFICQAGGEVSMYNPGGMVEHDLITGDLRGRGSHGGSRISTIGGSIRVGEFRPGPIGQHVPGLPGRPAFHVLKLTWSMRLLASLGLNGNEWNASTNPQGQWRWPAFNADGYVQVNNTAKYGDANGGFVRTGLIMMGTHMAIPWSVDIFTLGLETGMGLQFAWTLKHYGAVIVDDGNTDVSTSGLNASQGRGLGQFLFSAERGPNAGRTTSNSWIAQAEADWGYVVEGNNARVRNGNPGNGNNAWIRDYLRLMYQLQVVTNSTAANPGGPGARRWWTKVPATL